MSYRTLSPRNTLNRRRRSGNPGGFMFVFFGFVALAAITVGIIAFVGYFNENESANCVVTNTENAYNASTKSMDKRVYTENCGVFNVNDDPARLIFHSADTYGSIKAGETYTFTTTGFRIPLLSMFPNIITVK